jgi:hypothetical protein
MIRVRLIPALAVTIALAAAAPRADVKTQEKSLVKFEGMLGRVVGLFGGKAAKEGIVNTVAVTGDRKATFNDYTGTIIDLGEEKIYDLDMRGKRYTVKTFAELRREMEEAQRKAAEEARRQEKKPEKEQAPEKEYEVDLSVKETGQSKTIGGNACKQVVTTITVREKGKTLEQAGGIVMTADSWLAPRVAALEEITSFDRRYAEKLQGPAVFGSAEQMATAMAMWPGLKEAFSKYQSEGAGKVSGTPMLTTLTVEGVKSQEQAAQESKQEEERPSGIGGMLGGLGRRMSKKKPDENAGTGNRATIMTLNNEVLSVSTDVTPADVAIPTGFKQK